MKQLIDAAPAYFPDPRITPAEKQRQARQRRKLHDAKPMLPEFTFWEGPARITLTEAIIPDYSILRALGTYIRKGVPDTTITREGFQVVDGSIREKYSANITSEDGISKQLIEVLQTDINPQEQPDMYNTMQAVKQTVKLQDFPPADEALMNSVDRILTLEQGITNANIPYEFRVLSQEALKYSLINDLSLPRRFTPEELSQLIAHTIVFLPPAYPVGLANPEAQRQGKVNHVSHEILPLVQADRQLQDISREIVDLVVANQQGKLPNIQQLSILRATKDGSLESFVVSSPLEACYRKLGVSDGSQLDKALELEWNQRAKLDGWTLYPVLDILLNNFAVVRKRAINLADGLTQDNTTAPVLSSYRSFQNVMGDNAMSLSLYPTFLYIPPELVANIQPSSDEIVVKALTRLQQQKRSDMTYQQMQQALQLLGVKAVKKDGRLGYQADPNGTFADYLKSEKIFDKLATMPDDLEFEHYQEHPELLARMLWNANEQRYKFNRAVNELIRRTSLHPRYNRVGAILIGETPNTLAQIEVEHITGQRIEGLDLIATILTDNVIIQQFSKEKTDTTLTQESFGNQALHAWQYIKKAVIAGEMLSPDEIHFLTRFLRYVQPKDAREEETSPVHQLIQAAFDTEHLTVKERVNVFVDAFFRGKKSLARALKKSTLGIEQAQVMIAATELSLQPEVLTFLLTPDHSREEKRVVRRITAYMDPYRAQRGHINHHVFLLQELLRNEGLEYFAKRNLIDKEEAEFLAGYVVDMREDLFPVRSITQEQNSFPTVEEMYVTARDGDFTQIAAAMNVADDYRLRRRNRMPKRNIAYAVEPEPRLHFRKPPQGN